MWRIGSEAIKIRYSILNKLVKAGALSRETDVTPDKVHLTLRERQWLFYFVGGMERVKKMEKWLKRVKYSIFHNLFLQSLIFRYFRLFFRLSFCG